MMADGYPYVSREQKGAEFADKIRAGMQSAVRIVTEELNLSETDCEAVALEQCHSDESGIVYVTVVVEKPGSESAAGRLFRLGINDASPSPSVAPVTPADAARLEGSLMPLELRPKALSDCMM